MRKRTISLTLALLLCLSLATPALAASPSVAEVVAPKYDEAEPFSEGLAAVCRDGKWGFIDNTGEAIIPCRYYDARRFSEGLAPVKGENGEWGYIDKAGAEVIPCRHDDAYCFNEGLALVQDGSGWGYIDKTGAEAIPCRYDDAQPFFEGLAPVKGENGKWGYIDKTGAEAIPCRYDDVYCFNEGLALVQDGSGWGYIDRTGAEAIPCRYSRGEHFSESLAPVIDRSIEWSYIDKSGKAAITLPYRYYEAHPFSEGLAAVAKESKWGYIDKSGKVVIPCQYKWAGNFSDGFAFVKNKNGDYGYIDTAGKEIVPCQYDYADDFSEGLAAVCRDGKWGYISINTPSPSADFAYASAQSVTVDGKAVNFEMYALKDSAGNPTNYVKLRDIASVVNDTKAQFEVGWNGAVNIETGKPYTANGTEMSTSYSGDRTYTPATAATNVNGAAASLEAIVLTDDNGGAYTYYKLRDLGKALGFNVGWSAETGVFVETDKPYSET